MDDVGIIKSPDVRSPSNLPASPDAHSTRWRNRLTWGSLLVTLIAAAVVLPPLINVGRYQRQVTALVSRSLGRPVQLSSVELRLLPRPGFILNNLSVAEDPNFGTEPVLSARTVVASIGILSLWKGRLDIDRVSVDDASLNLVQSPQGHWNLESLMMGAQPALTQKVAGGSSSSRSKSASFPYLEATNSRVHLKRGLDKSPYSIMNTDLSLWQTDPGQWRVRLRGQPVRTDIEMSWADTGEVRMEATLRAAPELRNLPINLQMEWRDAHLGQLSRLILGSDAGWRGDLTADIDVQGTVGSAQTKARFQARGVRREEFAPETPLDLDANCSFEYRHSQNSIHALACSTAIGTGKLDLKAELPGSSGATDGTATAMPTAMLEVQQVPLQAALDLLHTVRAGFAPGISATGIANGSLIYKPVPLAPTIAETPRAQKLKVSSRKSSASDGAPANSVQGAIAISGAILKGGELKEPLILPTMSWVPNSTKDGPTKSLETTFTLNFAPSMSGNSPATVNLPAIKAQAVASTSNSHIASSTAPVSDGSITSQALSNPDATGLETTGPSPIQELAIHLALAQSGFTIAVKGGVSTPRLRSLAYALGLSHSEGLDSFSGGNCDLDLTANGPWVDTYEQAPSDASNNGTSPNPQLGPGSPTPPERAVAKAVSSSPRNSRSSLPAIASVAAASTPLDQPPATLQASGTLQIRHTQWKPSFLAIPVDLQQTIATVSGTRLSFTSEFSYGVAPATIKGSAIVQGSTACEGNDCEPQIQLHLGALDAATIQAALTYAPTKKSTLVPLIDRVRDRLHSEDKPAWPLMTLDVDADTLVLGPTTLHNPVAKVRINKDGDVQLESWETGLLGGEATGTGNCQWSKQEPEYEIEGTFTNISPALAGSLAAAHWSGSGPASGSVTGSGFKSGIEGKGKLKLSGLDWKELASSANGEIQFTWPQGLIATASQQPVRFENWSGILSVHDGKAELGPNTLISGKKSSSLAGSIPLGGPAKFTVAAPVDQVANAIPARNGAVPAATPGKAAQQPR